MQTREPTCRTGTTDAQSRWRVGLLALFVTSSALITQGRAEEPSPAYKITDGRPWTMTTDSRVGKLVLYRNGTGKMTGGPLDLSPTWRATPEGICLKPGGLLPEQCVQLVRTEQGYAGLAAGRTKFTLQR